jgi:hypothetical protein
MIDLEQLMQNVYQVELIINHDFFASTLEILDNIPVSGYTLIENTSGKCDRGFSCQDFDCTFNGNYILTVCSNEKQLNELVEQVTPILKKAGGICLVTKAKWIRH